MKAVLVIEEMPTECIECQFYRILADDKPKETRCILTAKRNEDGVNTRAEWCPLRPLPKEEESADEVVELGSYNEGYGNGYECGFADGWNACLKEITKWKVD
jgi:hypothetical protein